MASSQTHWNEAPPSREMYRPKVTDRRRTSSCPGWIWMLVVAGKRPLARACRGWHHSARTTRAATIGRLEDMAPDYRRPFVSRQGYAAVAPEEGSEAHEGVDAGERTGMREAVEHRTA